MFMSYLSMTLYNRVVCHYLISGHSYMMPERVVSHIKKSFVFTSRNDGQIV